MQSTATTDTKVKVVQSKPGWAVRPPPPVSQSAWGIPNVDHLVTSDQKTTSVAAVKPPQIRMPASQSPSSKQPVDVSRQLFPDNRTSNSPSPLSVDSKQRALGASVESMESQSSASHSPASNHLSNIPQGAKQSMAGIIAPPYMPPPVVTAIGNKVAHPSASGGQVATSTPYFPFESNKVPGTYPIPSLERAGQDGARNLVHPSKAPGFRSAPQYPMDPGTFSRAPGSRSGIPYSAEQAILIKANMDECSGMPVGYTDDKGVLLLGRDHYTTIGQPMTLPHISSSLNPNASEFTAPNRFVNGMQHSPMTNISQHQRASPIEMRSTAAVYQPQQRPKSAMSQVSADQVIHIVFQIFLHKLQPK